MNNFDRIKNKPIAFGSWLVAAADILAMSLLKPQGALLYICIGIFVVCFILFGWQAVQANRSMWADAKRGAEVRQKEEEQGRKP